MRWRRALAVPAMAAALSGCLAVWGSTYKVRYQNETGIGIDFDPLVTTLGNVQVVAQDHCNRYGKDSVVRHEDKNAWGVRSIQFACRVRTP